MRSSDFLSQRLLIQRYFCPGQNITPWLANVHTPASPQIQYHPMASKCPHPSQPLDTIPPHGQQMSTPQLAPRYNITPWLANVHTPASPQIQYHPMASKCPHPSQPLDTIPPHGQQMSTPQLAPRCNTTPWLAYVHTPASPQIQYHPMASKCPHPSQPLDTIPPHGQQMSAPQLAPRYNTTPWLANVYTPASPQIQYHPMASKCPHPSQPLDTIPPHGQQMSAPQLPPRQNTTPWLANVYTPASPQIQYHPMASKCPHPSQPLDTIPPHGQQMSAPQLPPRQNTTPWLANVHTPASPQIQYHPMASKCPHPSQPLDTIPPHGQQMSTPQLAPRYNTTPWLANVHTPASPLIQYHHMASKCPHPSQPLDTIPPHGQQMSTPQLAPRCNTTTWLAYVHTPASPQIQYHPMASKCPHPSQPLDTIPPHGQQMSAPQLAPRYNTTPWLANVYTPASPQIQYHPMASKCPHPSQPLDTIPPHGQQMSAPQLPPRQNTTPWLANVYTPASPQIQYHPMASKCPHPSQPLDTIPPHGQQMSAPQLAPRQNTTPWLANVHTPASPQIQYHPMASKCPHPSQPLDTIPPHGQQMSTPQLAPRYNTTPWLANVHTPASPLIQYHHMASKCPHPSQPLDTIPPHGQQMSTPQLAPRCNTTTWLAYVHTPASPQIQYHPMASKCPHPSQPLDTIPPHGQQMSAPQLAPRYNTTPWLANVYTPASPQIQYHPMASKCPHPSQPLDTIPPHGQQMFTPQLAPRYNITPWLANVHTPASHQIQYHPMASKCPHPSQPLDTIPPHGQQMSTPQLAPRCNTTPWLANVHTPASPQIQYHPMASKCPHPSQPLDTISPHGQQMSAPQLAPRYNTNAWLANVRTPASPQIEYRPIASKCPHPSQPLDRISPHCQQMSAPQLAMSTIPLQVPITLTESVEGKKKENG